MRNLRQIIITLVFFWFAYSVFDRLAADMNYIQAQKLNSINRADRSVKNNPNEPRYHYGRAKLYLNGNKELALQDLRAAEELNPKNLVTLRNMVPLYYFLVVGNLDLAASTMNLDNKYLPVVIDFYESLSDKYPNDVGVQVLIAKYEKKLGLSDLYVEKTEKIRLLRPDLLEWHPDLQ